MINDAIMPGSVTVYFDAIRIENNQVYNPDCKSGVPELPFKRG